MSTQKMEVLATYKVEDVLHFIGNDDKQVEFSGTLVSMHSSRLISFKLNGCKCVSCGITGNAFSLERPKYGNTKKYHFNLYYIDCSEKRLMTKDHIIPKSKGGQNILSNYQTMCFDCNQEKGNKIPNDNIKVGDIICKNNRKKFRDGKRTAEIEMIGFKWIPNANYKNNPGGKIVSAVYLKGISGLLCVGNFNKEKSKINQMKRRDMRI